MGKLPEAAAMTVQEMIEQATPSPIRAPWCVKMHDRCVSVLTEGGSVTAAAILSAAADKRGMDIVEVCRVTRGSYQAVYARLEPREAA